MEDIMKKKMAAFLAVSMLLCGQALAADFSNLVIIHTNDTHGFDRRGEGINGMATVSALRKHYLSQGKDVLLVDAGDAIQDNNLVNFSKGKSAIAFMNAAGYDAMALGNHEFDYGQEVLAERVREAKFPHAFRQCHCRSDGKAAYPGFCYIQKRGCEDRNHRSHYAGNRGDDQSEKCIWVEISGR